MSSLWERRKEKKKTRNKQNKKQDVIDFILDFFTVIAEFILLPFRIFYWILRGFGKLFGEIFDIFN